MEGLQFQIYNNIPVTTSRSVAELFGKEHKNVLRVICGENRKGVHIDGLIDELNKNNAEISKYFIKSSYDNHGRTYVQYLITRDGFVLTAMKFTGKQATDWKVKYINGFNMMENTITEEAQKRKDQKQNPTVDSYMIEDPAERARRWAEEYEEKKELSLKNEKLLEDNKSLSMANEEMKPKADFYDQVSKMDDVISVSKMAALLSKEGHTTFNQNRLFAYLRQKGFLCSADYVWNKPSQEMINKKYMTYNEFSRKVWNSKKCYYEQEISFSPKITGLGQQFLVKVIKRDTEIIKQWIESGKI